MIQLHFHEPNELDFLYYSLYAESADAYSFYIAGFLMCNMIGLAVDTFRIEMVKKN